jgi:alpha/beta superfamily hydrolase
VAVLEVAIKQWDPVGALPVVLAGFSFGAFVQAHVAKRLCDTGRATPRLVLVALAVGTIQGARSYEPPPIPSNSILIHGDHDEVVPLANVVSFAEASHVAVTVVPGADHFFHGRLNQIRAIVEAAWTG